MNENKTYGAPVERGRITSISENGCTVRSYTRDVITPPLQALRKSTLAVNDNVYYVLYPDGTGKILGKFTDEDSGGGGEAETAVRLKYKRSIGLQGEVTGSELFDGSEDIGIETKVAEMTNLEIDAIFAAVDGGA